ncbi:hypothetical protein AM493_13350 [Flavobacterium akiainvivens]|uniref:Fibronectin type-III domain-containing protein n=1 Tax=Flavobacterium akiainvivens TaxID=1202724 RepID=A0A0N0RQU5_9FLAO|nr:hypothetical protein AM493_13350 [Flavobacterium akiainvivens]
MGLAQTTETFEGAWTTPNGPASAGGPAGWAIVNHAGIQQKWELGTTGSYQGSQHAVIAPESVAAGTIAEDWLITPAFAVPENGVLSFYSKLAQPGDQGTTFHIYVRPIVNESFENQINIVNFTSQAANWTELQINPSQTDWTHKMVSLSSFVGQNVYLAFVAKGNNGDTWMIDNVDVVQACMEPMYLMAYDAGPTQFTVSWTDTANATSWEIEIVPVNAAPSGTGTVVTSVPYTFTNLMPGVTYKVYIRAMCAPGEYSIWTPPLQVSTASCPPETMCNYTFNLTDTAGNGWGNNHFTVYQYGLPIGEIWLESGSEATVEVPMCDNVPFQIEWSIGDVGMEEVGFTVENAFSQTVFTLQNQEFDPADMTIFNGLAQCQADFCYTPINLSVYNNQGASGTVSWDGSGDSYEYYLQPYNDNSPLNENTIPTGTANSTTVTIETPGLFGLHRVYVRSVCAGLGGNITSEWSSGLNIYFGADNYIEGTVMADVNADGLCNTQDLAVPGLGLQVTVAEEEPYLIYTNAQGAFTIADLPYGTDVPVTVVPVETPLFETIAPVTIINTFPAATPPQVSLCMGGPQPYTDVSVTLVPGIAPLLGFNGSCYVMVQNNSGTVAQNITVLFNYEQDKVSVEYVAGGYTQVDANTISFTVSNIAPFGNSSTYINYSVLPPPVNLMDDVLTFSGEASVDGDEVAGNNTNNLQQTIVASYDPNDIVVHEGEWVNIDNANDYLHYTIRFQNTGTAMAVNIRIENELDEDLDWDTFEPIVASHSYQAIRRNGNELEFLFNNIFLPDSTHNEPASHGFVTYRVKPKADIAVNDEIHSTAAIYFDFNEPVITNTAITVFGVLSLPDNRLQNVRLYPNPVKDQLYISVLDGSLKSIQVFDLNGRLCLSSDGQSAVNTHALTTGLYMVKVETDSGTSSFKLIKQ